MDGKNQTESLLHSTHCLTHQECRIKDQHATCIGSTCECTSSHIWDGTNCVISTKFKPAGCINRLVSCVLISSLVGILFLAIIILFIYKIYKLQHTMRSHITLSNANNNNNDPYSSANSSSLSPIGLTVIQTEPQPPEYFTVIKRKESDPMFSMLPSYEEALDKMNRDSLQSGSSVHTQTEDQRISTLSSDIHLTCFQAVDETEIDSNSTISHIKLPEPERSEINSIDTVHNTLETLPYTTMEEDMS